MVFFTTETQRKQRSRGARRRQRSRGAEAQRSRGAEAQRRRGDNSQDIFLSSVSGGKKVIKYPNFFVKFIDNYQN